MDLGQPQTLISPSEASSVRPTCHCLNVTEGEIRQAIADNELHSVRGVSQACGAGSGCMSCHRHIRRMLNERVLQRRSQSLEEISVDPPCVIPQFACGS
jgi:bacterioferritin-associated ferredoxin